MIHASLPSWLALNRISKEINNKSTIYPTPGCSVTLLHDVTYSDYVCTHACIIINQSLRLQYMVSVVRFCS